MMLTASGSGVAPEPPPDEAVRLPLVVQASSQPDFCGFDPVVTPGAFQVFCDVLLVDAPAGGISQAKELWSHLREDTLGVTLADHLARNGFRVGIGKTGDFAAVSSALAGVRDARRRPGRLRFESDNALEIMIDPQVRARRPFVYSLDGAVRGDEYPTGVAYYWVQAWHDIEQIDSVNLKLVPEIRYGRERTRVYSPGMPRNEQYRDVGRMFNEVKLDIRLARGEFLVLAPRATEGAALVLGRSLLCDDSNNASPRELVLLIRPRVARGPE